LKQALDQKIVLQVSQLSFESWAAPGFVALKRSISRKYSSMGLMAAMGEKLRKYFFFNA
jgi:hypothetical protein